MNVENFIQRLGNISPSAKHYLDCEGYLHNFDEDDVALVDYVRQVFSLMIGDFHEIGVDFTCTLNDLCESDEAMEYGLMLGELLLPTPLYQSLQEHADLRTTLTALISGGTGDDLLINQMMEWIQETESFLQETYLPVANFFADKVTSSPVFDQYLSNILTMDNQISNSPDIDVSRYKNYIEKLDRQMTTAKVTLRMLLAKTSISPESMVEVGRRLNQSHQIMTSPQYIASFSFASEEFPHPTEENDNVRAAADAYRTCKSLMHEMVPLFPEYYRSRGLPISQNIIALILVYTRATNVVEENFYKATADLKGQLGLTPEQNVYFGRLVSVLKELGDAVFT